MKKHFINSAGFTLIEVLVAATIIAVLASVAVTSYSTATKNSRDAKRKTDLANLAAASELYRADIGSYVATTTGGIDSLAGSNNLSTALVSTYIAVIPTDPKPSGHIINTNYKYTNQKNGVNSIYQYCLAAILENVANGNGTASSNPCGQNYGAQLPNYNYFVPSP